jgi:hypothetical protein
MTVFRIFAKVMILSPHIFRKLKGSLMNSLPQVAPSLSWTSIYMFFGVSAVTFVILLQVFQQNLTLCRILNPIATYPLMNFYIEVLFNSVPWLHRCCQRLHNPLLPLLPNGHFQGLMALVLPPSGAEEDIMACVTCAPPLPSIVAIVSNEETTSIIGNSIVETGNNIVQTGSKTDPTLVSGGAS